MRNFLSALAFIGASTAAQAGFVVTIEDPSVQSSTANFTYRGVETFDGRATGTGKTFTTTFGGNQITGEYRNVQIINADQYGGAGGTGQYAVTFEYLGSYSLNLSTLDPRGINFFGFWLSALDSGNYVRLFKGNNQVFQFTPTDVLNAVSGNVSYYCNPNAQYRTSNCGEPYVFVNIYDVGDTFDRIEFAEVNSGGGYESDNHTVGFWAPPIRGRVVSGVLPTPAPATLAIFGLGLIGLGAARRRA
ncbi:MAG: PEP-CTERM sorting domain-containing protein [Sphingomonadaceae bacterium]|nr:PEP-CTERM sorting domain-containing protein [Sphingomonadaceae bacterium]